MFSDRDMRFLNHIVATLPRDLMFRAASDLGVLGKDRKTLFLEHEDEIHLIADRAIHDIPWDIPIKISR